jgi:hypothetical protein
MRKLPLLLLIPLVAAFTSLFTQTPTPTPAQTMTLTFAWDAGSNWNDASNPVTSVTLLEKINGVFSKIVGTGPVPPNTLTIGNVTPGPHTYVLFVTAKNGVSSKPSDEVSVNIPDAPQNVRITVTYTIP